MNSTSTPDFVLTMGTFDHHSPPVAFVLVSTVGDAQIAELLRDDLARLLKGNDQVVHDERGNVL